MRTPRLASEPKPIVRTPCLLNVDDVVAIVNGRVTIQSRLDRHGLVDSRIGKSDVGSWQRT